jgi:hypothetical protein
MPILTRYCTEYVEMQCDQKKEPLRNESEDRARKYTAAPQAAVDHSLLEKLLLEFSSKIR